MVIFLFDFVNKFFEIPIILKTLNINKLRATIGNSIRRLIGHSLKTVL